MALAREVNIGNVFEFRCLLYSFNNQFRLQLATILPNEAEALWDEKF